MKDHPREPDPFCVDPENLTESELAKIRAMTPGEKIAASFALREKVLQVWADEIRTERPDAGDHEVRMRVAARYIPRDLMIAAYGWDPDKLGALLDEGLHH